jgi:hypothetical protein
MRLSSWRPSIPPCTNHSSSANATCVVCDEAEPLSSCGKLRPSDGQMLCNWRFVECRARQVVAISMARKVSAGALVWGLLLSVLRFGVLPLSCMQLAA